MEIKILGMGCPKCNRLEELAREVTSDLGIEATFTKVKDIDAIMAYEVVSTPALVIDEEVSRRVASRARKRSPSGSVRRKDCRGPSCRQKPLKDSRSLARVWATDSRPRRRYAHARGRRVAYVR